MKKVKKEGKFRINKQKFNEILEKEKVEHAMIMGSTIAIVLLLGFLSYSMYTFYQTKAETTSQINSLTGSVTDLSEEKTKLISDKDDLTEQWSACNATAKDLNEQVKALIEERDDFEGQTKDLTSDLESLQEDYDALIEERDTLQSDLEDCEASCP